jgi:hypothetical protein
MAVFDRLPPFVRQTIASAPYPARAADIEDLLFRLRCHGIPAAQAEQLVTMSLPQAWEDNLRAFAQTYQRRHKLPLIHAAAAATFLVDRRGGHEAPARG